MSRTLNILRYYVEKIGYGLIALVIFVAVTGVIIYSLFFIGKVITIYATNFPQGYTISGIINGKYVTGIGDALVLTANMFKQTVLINPIITKNLQFQTIYSPNPRILVLTKNNNSVINVNFTQKTVPNYLFIVTNNSYQVYTYNPYTNQINLFRQVNGIVNITGMFLFNISANPSIYEQGYQYLVLTTAQPKIFLLNLTTFIPTLQTTSAPVLYMYNQSQYSQYSIIEVSTNSILVQTYGSYEFFNQQTYKLNNMYLTAATVAPQGNLIAINGTSSFLEFNNNFQVIASVPLNNNNSIVALFSGPITTFGEYAYVVTSRGLIVVNELSDTIQSSYSLGNVTSASSALNYLEIATMKGSKSYVYVYNETTGDLEKTFTFSYPINAELYTGSYLYAANSTSLNVFDNSGNLITYYNIKGIRYVE